MSDANKRTGRLANPVSVIMAGAIVLLLCSFASASTYEIGPGKTYTNIGDAPWSTLTAGDTVNIYPKTAITGTTANSSTGTTITLTTSAGSIPYGSTVWFAGYTGIMPWVTCGQYGSGLYSTAKGGTACAGSTVTLSNAVSVGSGVTVYFTPPYFEKLVLAPAGLGTAENPIVIQGVPDPTTGALPILDSHHATTGPNMAHTGSTQWHDAYGFVLFAKNSGQTAWPKYLTLKKLRLQGGRNGLTGYDGTNASYTYAANSGIRFEAAENVTIEENEIVNNDNGLFGATNPDSTPAQFMVNITIRGNHLWQNGYSSGSHQSYLEANGIVYEHNWYDVPATGSSCSQLKDRSAGTVIRYNLFYPSARELDLVASQNGAAQLVPQTVLTVPAGGFANGATSLTFGTSVSGVSIGDMVGYVNATAGWGYPGTLLPTMPVVSGVNTGTNTLTLATGIPAALSAGYVLHVIKRSAAPYTQSFVYGNVFDWDQGLYWASQGAVVHYGWDTASGIDSVYDRAGTLYFYHNTVITRWDQSGSTGASYGSGLFQTESEADTIRADNNLFYVTNANNGNTPTYLIVLSRSAYIAGLVTATTFGGGKNLIVTSSGVGSNTCGSITLSGWAACVQAPTSGASIDISNWTAITAAQAYPNGLTGTRDYRLQAGSSAINAATALPAAITSNTLGLDLTPTSQYGGTARTNVVDIGAYQYTEGTPDPPTTNGVTWGNVTLSGVTVQ